MSAVAGVPARRLRTCARRPAARALSGGVGGAKLADGLARAADPRSLLVVANTRRRLRAPRSARESDVDTVLYTSAGVSDRSVAGAAPRNLGLHGSAWRPRRSDLVPAGRPGSRAAPVAHDAAARRRLALDRHDRARRPARRARPGHAMTTSVSRRSFEDGRGVLGFQEYLYTGGASRACAAPLRGRRRPTRPALRRRNGAQRPRRLSSPSIFLSVDPILAVAGVRECSGARAHR